MRLRLAAGSGLPPFKKWIAVEDGKDAKIAELVQMVALRLGRSEHGLRLEMKGYELDKEDYIADILHENDVIRVVQLDIDGDGGHDLLKIPLSNGTQHLPTLSESHPHGTKRKFAAETSMQLSSPTPMVEDTLAIAASPQGSHASTSGPTMPSAEAERNEQASPEVQWDSSLTSQPVQQDKVPTVQSDVSCLVPPGMGKKNTHKRNLRKRKKSKAEKEKVRQSFIADYKAGLMLPGIDLSGPQHKQDTKVLNFASETMHDEVQASPSDLQDVTKSTQTFASIYEETPSLRITAENDTLLQDILSSATSDIGGIAIVNDLLDSPQKPSVVDQDQDLVVAEASENHASTSEEIPSESKFKQQIQQSSADGVESHIVAPTAQPSAALRVNKAAVNRVMKSHLSGNPSLEFSTEREAIRMKKAAEQLEWQKDLVTQTARQKGTRRVTSSVPNASILKSSVFEVISESKPTALLPRKVKRGDTKTSTQSQHPCPSKILADGTRPSPLAQKADTDRTTIEDYSQSNNPGIHDQFPAWQDRVRIRAFECEVEGGALEIEPPELPFVDERKRKAQSIASKKTKKPRRHTMDGEETAEKEAQPQVSSAVVTDKNVRSEEQQDRLKFIEFDSLRKLSGPPEVGSVIAFKTLIMGANYAPQLSDWFVATVLQVSVDNKDKFYLRFKLFKDYMQHAHPHQDKRYDPITGERILGRFEGVDSADEHEEEEVVAQGKDEQTSGIEESTWEYFLEPRLVSSYR